MLNIARVLALLLFVAATAGADELITRASSHGVTETMDRFEQVVRDAGFRVFARIDHAEGAGAVGMTLRPTQLLIFGNPKLGTRLMQSNQRIAIDLPLRVLVWRDAAGKVWLAYRSPADLLQAFSIDDRPKLQEKMTGALARFARAAAGD